MKTWKQTGWEILEGGKMRMYSTGSGPKPFVWYKKRDAKEYISNPSDKIQRVEVIVREK